MPYASQALIGARGFSSQRKSCIFRKLHNNVAAGEKEVSERTSFFYMCTWYDSILKIDGRNLTHTDGNHSCKCTAVHLNDYDVSGFNRLPANRFREVFLTALLFPVIDDHTAGSIILGNLQYLQNCWVHDT